LRRRGRRGIGLRRSGVRLRRKGSVIYTKYIKQDEIALSAFERIRAAFPALAVDLDLNPKNVDIALDIPVQTGLSFNVHLDLQNLDELHLSASALWVSWFPCTNPEKVDSYVQAVSGLLSGEFRILEHWRGKRSVKAKLQAPIHNGWKTIAGSSVLLSIPWPPKRLKVVQNLLLVEAVRDLNDRPVV
jgi:hypothetical protein